MQQAVAERPLESPHDLCGRWTDCALSDRQAVVNSHPKAATQIEIASSPRRPRLFPALLRGIDVAAERNEEWASEESTMTTGRQAGARREESIQEKSRRLMAESRALASRFHDINLRIKEAFARSMGRTEATRDMRKRESR